MGGYLIEDYLQHLSYNEVVQCGLKDSNSLFTQTGKSLLDYDIPLPEEQFSECDAQQEYDIHQAVILGEMLNAQQI